MTIINRDSAITDLAYLIAGLVTITPSRLVHRMLQGVEHTDPTQRRQQKLKKESEQMQRHQMKVKN